MQQRKRIAEMLDRFGAEGRTALVPYFTAGDPDIDVTRRAVLAAVEAGADAIELGVPFSDPIADGPVIQASAQRAIAAGSSLPRVLELTEKLRRDIDVPIVLFGYYNPFFHYGEEALARDARTVGADGMLVTDLPPEEAEGLVAACREHALDPIFLLAPTSTPERMQAVARVASGFIYMVAVTGVTGARSVAPTGIEDLVAAARGATGLPVGVGFGIGTPEQAAAVSEYADLVIVGSALVRRMHEAGSEAAVEAAREFIAALRQGIDRADDARR